MRPFQLEIMDESDRVILVLEVDEVASSDPADDDGLSDAYIGKVVRENMPDDLRTLLRQYCEALQDASLRYADTVQSKLLALNLRVVGIPSKERSVRLFDFQLEPNGAFLLRIEVDDEDAP